MLTTQDIEKYQKAVQGIDAAQNALSPEEQQAFVELKIIFSTGNYAAIKGKTCINVLKNGLARNGSNRLLQVHLRNFFEICDKCFKGTGGNMQTGNSNPSAEKKKGGNNTFVSVIIIAVVGWFSYKNWDSVSEFFGLNSEVVESQIEISETQSLIDEPFTPNTISTAENIVIEETVEEVVPQQTVNQNNSNNSSDYQLATRLLTENDLRELSKARLRILHNEIYARHGYIFPSKDLQEYFSRQSWYQPRSKDVTHLLTATEKKNVELIRKQEASASSGDQNNNGAAQSPSVRTATATVPSHSPDLQPSNRLLTETDLAGLSKARLRILRNEIYARHGYIFQSKDLQEYFSRQSWYQPRSRDVTHLLTATEKKNVEFIKIYETSASGGDKNSNGASDQIRSSQIQSPPPIVNTNGWNARIRLPEAWNGTSVLANGFIFIPFEDKKLQNKYNVHPGGRSPKDGHIYFDENDCYNEACWWEILDEDERYYEYPLSPAVIIEAGFYKEESYSRNQKMTFSEFANYYKNMHYCDTNSCYGMLANVTYLNGVITKIVEQYTP